MSPAELSNGDLAPLALLPGYGTSETCICYLVRKLTKTGKRPQSTAEGQLASRPNILAPPRHPPGEGLVSMTWRGACGYGCGSARARRRTMALTGQARAACPCTVQQLGTFQSVLCVYGPFHGSPFMNVLAGA